jgi:FlaA1/EpsC-like NDP-sugar epimerase
MLPSLKPRSIEWIRRASLSRTRTLFRRLVLGLYRYRLFVVAIVYIALTAIANYSAMWLRFDGTVPPEERARVLRLMPAMIAINATCFVPFGIYRSSWRYTSIWDLRDLVLAASLSAFLFYLIVSQWFPAYPRSIILMTALLMVSLIGGARLIRRIADDLLLAKDEKRVLIIGAGDAGEMIARDMRKKGHSPIGFIDDEPAKQGQAIHRVRVLGTRNDLTRIVAAEQPDEVLIAMPSASPSVIRHFVSALEQFKVPIMTLPPLREIPGGRVTESQVRRVALEDLLPRLPVRTDIEQARALVEGRRILVTGAGGCIGSELCRQIAGLDPDRLIIYERYENNLYSVLNTLPKNFRIRPALGDVTDRRRLHAVMREYRPNVIFHAAAHKHVPLMELNPGEAVKNNVIGTRMVAEAAAHYGADRFILISTDKAVNPSSLMGATKRVAELVIQAMVSDTGPLWGTVRFGNVLGSTGSVVLRWMDQIAAGGPVTVTHPEAQRYFMLIPEAVHLILRAASITSGGEIFALEMGEQINLLKMARDLIRLSGYIPEEEIGITITGLRPGEKLSEELVGPDEHMECSPLDKILQLRPVNPPDPMTLLTQVSELGAFALRGDTRLVIDQLCQIVPTFQPGELLIHGSEQASSSPGTSTRYGKSARRGHRGGTSLGVRDASKSPPAVEMPMPGGNGNGSGVSALRLRAPGQGRPREVVAMDIVEDFNRAATGHSLRRRDPRVE